jgi:hypothetical protein
LTGQEIPLIHKAEESRGCRLLEAHQPGAESKPRIILVDEGFGLGRQYNYNACRRVCRFMLVYLRVMIIMNPIYIAVSPYENKNFYSRTRVPSLLLL